MLAKISCFFGHNCFEVSKNVFEDAVMASSYHEVIYFVHAGKGDYLFDAVLL